MLKAITSCHDNHKQLLNAFNKVHCSKRNTNLIIADQIEVNTLSFGKGCIRKVISFFLMFARLLPTAIFYLHCQPH